MNLVALPGLDDRMRSESALTRAELERHLVTGVEAARVLIVDGEPATTAQLSGLLAQWGCEDVRVTNDTAAVIAMCAEVRPDLLVLDLHMRAP